MDLWVRSQDKERLTKAQDLRIYHAKNENVWVIEDCYDLGQYKTKERVLEVLDEIQRCLVVINDKNDNLFYVYDMPKE